ncbi:uncharacterized protein PSFLO_05669 [Pseudozyma flocculosa]|uniref:Uncharacterized protein n=1 Tax=Pseudozyma flocculosa TaxID=84751 RepID=A0A5C3F8Y8_9BASI|nr:uncharacterized protein PSFLO_05669 [Pseudozyma flocculosa]
MGGSPGGRECCGTLAWCLGGLRWRRLGCWRTLVGCLDPLRGLAALPAPRAGENHVWARLNPGIGAKRYVRRPKVRAAFLAYGRNGYLRAHDKTGFRGWPLTFTAVSRSSVARTETDIAGLGEPYGRNGPPTERKICTGGHLGALTAVTQSPSWAKIRYPRPHVWVTAVAPDIPVRGGRQTGLYETYGRIHKQLHRYHRYRRECSATCQNPRPEDSGIAGSLRFGQARRAKLVRGRLAGGQARLRKQGLDPGPFSKRTRKERVARHVSCADPWTRRAPWQAGKQARPGAHCPPKPARRVALVAPVALAAYSTVDQPRRLGRLRRAALPRCRQDGHQAGAFRLGCLLGATLAVVVPAAVLGRPPWTAGLEAAAFGCRRVRLGALTPSSTRCWRWQIDAIALPALPLGTVVPVGAVAAQSLQKRRRSS